LQEGGKYVLQNKKKKEEEPLQGKKKFPVRSILGRERGKTAQRKRG